VSEQPPEHRDKSKELPDWPTRFLTHLGADKGASIYTQRNYRQALVEFTGWFTKARKTPPEWETLERDDFREYLRYLGRSKLSRAATQLRFSALRSFYKYLIRNAILAASPIKNIKIPKLPKRLPRFLTIDNLLALLKAPGQSMEQVLKANPKAPVSVKGV